MFFKYVAQRKLIGSTDAIIMGANADAYRNVKYSYEMEEDDVSPREQEKKRVAFCRRVLCAFFGNTFAKGKIARHVAWQRIVLLRNWAQRVVPLCEQTESLVAHVEAHNQWVYKTHPRRRREKLWHIEGEEEEEED